MSKKYFSDLVVFGNPDLWVLICKAGSAQQNWMKSTKAMEVPNGCVLQVTTTIDKSTSESTCFVPDVCIKEDDLGNKYLGQK